MSHPTPLPIDVRPFGESISEARTNKVSKSDSLEILRIVLAAGKEVPPHRAPGEITVHCLEGRILFGRGDSNIELTAGMLLHLDGSQEHWLKAVEPSSLLVTKVL